MHVSRFQWPVAADVLLNIKGLEKRCSLSVTEKLLWGVPAQALSSCRGEMTRMKGRTGRRGSPPSPLLLSICCLSPFCYSPYKLNPHQPSLQLQVWTPNGKNYSLSCPQHESLGARVFWLNEGNTTNDSLCFFTLNHSLSEQLKTYLFLNSLF